MKSIFLSGYYGFGNLGDELLLKNIAALFRDLGFEDIAAVSGDPAYSSGKHPEIRFVDRNDYRKIVDEVRRSDMVALGGGTLFQDHNRMDTADWFESPKWGVNSYVNVPLIARICGKPTAYLFQGAGPFFTEDARQFTRYAYSLGDYISVRDRESEKVLKELDVSGIVLSGDPVLLNPLDVTKPERRRPLIGISLRQWVEKDLEDRIVSAFVRFLGMVKGDFDFSFISFQDFDSVNSDTRIYDRIESELGDSVNVRLVRSADYSLEDIEGLIAGCDFLVGMRLHAVMLAIKYGIPFLAIPYWNKVSNLLDETGLQECALDIETISGEGIAEKFQARFPGTKEERERIAGARTMLQERLEYGIETLREFVGRSGRQRAVHVTDELPGTASFLPGDWITYRAYQSKMVESFRENRHGGLRVDRILRRGRYKGIIIYPSHMAWDIPLFQRPHHLLLHLSEMGYLVFFITPDAAEDRAEPLREVRDNLCLVGDPGLLRGLSGENVILWIEWTPHIVFKDLFPGARIVYDWMDEIEAFYLYSRLMEIDHRKLLLLSDAVFASSGSLLSEARQFREDAVLVQNGVSVDDFRAPEGGIPGDMEGIVSQGRPVIGFYGSMEKWRIDYDLVNYLVRENSDLNFVFIGPSYDSSVSSIKKAGNVFLLGPKRYEDLKYYLRHFDVAVIPYRVDRITKAVFPVKLCEYMAGGKAIVSTMLEECIRFRSVFVSADHEEFSRNLRDALMHKNDPDYQALLREEALANTWQKRCEAVDSVLSTLPAGRQKKGLGPDYLWAVCEELDVTEKMLGSLLHEKERVDREYGNTMAEKVELWNSYQQLKRDKDELWNGMQQLQREKEALENDREEIQKRLDEVLGENNMLSGRLQSIYGSYFWRLGSPFLRAVDNSRILRKVAAGARLLIDKGSEIRAAISSRSPGRDSPEPPKVRKPVTEYDNPYQYVELLKDITVDFIDRDFDAGAAGTPFSMITTVKNESRNIVNFLRSIESQTVIPREVIIVDGGSGDGTVEMIERFAGESALNIRVVKSDTPLNISQGRNMGLRHAGHDIIVLTDAGCVLHNDMCRNLVGCFSDPEVDLASGVYHALHPSAFAGYFIYDWDNFDVKSFLPSGRCVAVRKSVAQETGGYPEFLTRTGEDTLFDINYRKRSAKWVINRRAYVYWDAPKSREEAIKLGRTYGEGDGESGIGDFRFYDVLSRTARGEAVPGDFVNVATFNGYMEGRKRRSRIEIERRGVKGCAIVLSRLPLTELEKAAQLARDYTNKGFKVICVNTMKGRGRRFLDIDYTLLELYHVSDFDVDEFAGRYADIPGGNVIAVMTSRDPLLDAVIEDLRRRIAGIQVLVEHEEGSGEGKAAPAVGVSPEDTSGGQAA